MRYWWVNQNQTYRHEVPGGYLWSPKRKSNGHRNPFYEFMREVSPGDMVFSFADTWIRAFGVARSNAYEAPRPEEFGEAGRNWSRIGWRVDIEFHEVNCGFRPVDWIERLRPLLPKHYAPLREDGRGLQSIYLTEIPEVLALTLADLLGGAALKFARAEVEDKLIVTPSAELVLWEEHLTRTIQDDESIPPTEKEALILARRGQGTFRRRVARLENRCRVTGVDRPEHLRASHCKPWRDCDNEERLDGENGLMLTPSIDHLFDRGFISFEENGRLLVSPVAHRPSLQRMGVEVERELNVGRFTATQGRFLEFHRDAVFLRSDVANAAS
ncbi:MAG TPA: HNH endonuclease [bacterium]|nr:HNH endonuclease [bacterium]